jgi:outer membrane receptor protein involved in Fe transport
MLKRLLIFLLLIPLFSWAQSAGKITGYVVDSKTGEPLAGANVLLEGTLMGAQSDAEGFYFILNVPVGAHDLRAVFVGYQDVLVQDVRVSSNTTVNQNFEMTETAIELDEAIVVTAGRPLVEKNVTQSYSLVTAEAIENIPVRGLNNLLALQASVVVQDGNVYIRGGRTEEVGYYLDGASVTNPISNTNSVYVIQEAVEEIQVLTGGFSAEFGGSNSGIVRSELKKGSNDYRFSLDAQTDMFASEGSQFLNTYSYQDYYLNFSAGGPITENIKFYTAVENSRIGDTMKRFVKGFSFDAAGPDGERFTNDDLVDSNPLNSRVIAGTPDTVNNLSYKNGFTPRNELDRWAINSTLSFDFSPFQVRLSGIYNYAKTYAEFHHPIREILNDRDQYTETNTLLLTGKFTHSLSPRTYYDLKVSYYDRSVDEFDDYFGNNWELWSDSAAIHNQTNGRVVYRAAYDEPYTIDLYGIPFYRDGTLETTYYDKNAQQYYGISGDLVSQLDKFNELKVGFDFRQYTLRQFNVRPDIFKELGASTTSLEQISDASWRRYTSSLTGIYGYDRYGNELDSGVDGAKQPIFGAAYIQDKIEYDDLIINAGVRLDYFDSDDRTLIDRTAPVVSFNQIDETSWKDLDPFILVSPRLGFSFPVSERTVFYTQYGKFAQMPELNDSYYGIYQYASQIVVGGNYYGANPIGFGLEPIKTTAYEIGFRHQLGDYAAMDITGFYKNVKGEPTTIRVATDPRLAISNYNLITNGDFSTTKGFELKLQLRRINNVMAQLNYTFANAEGTGSGETAHVSAVEQNDNTPTITSPLTFAQRHRGSINLDYRFGRDEGGPVFNRFGVNTLFSFNSGHPYTRVYYAPGGQVSPYEAGVDYMLDTRSREALEPINASTTPWNFNFDLQVDKSFDIMENLDAMVYMRVTNLFNTKNVINVYQATGSAHDDGYLADPDYSGTYVNNYGEGYVQLYNAINRDNGAAFSEWTATELFSNPRQILFGIKLVY